MRASWGTGEATIRSRADLDTVVGAIRLGGQPTMVFLHAEDGSVLVFGVGRNESILTFAAADGATVHSHRDRERKGSLTFFCRDQLDEFMAEMAVPEDVALLAAEQFLATQQRPAGVSWEPDW